MNAHGVRLAAGLKGITLLCVPGDGRRYVADSLAEWTTHRSSTGISKVLPPHCRIIRCCSGIVGRAFSVSHRPRRDFTG